MKMEKKILVVSVISIMILFSLLTGKNYAENEIVDETIGTDNSVSQESNNTQEGNQENEQESNQEGNEVTDNNTEDSNIDTSNPPAESTTTNNTQQATKSSNAYLSDLGILPHDFKGFKYATTYYEVTVPEETETVEVYATVQHSKATLTGTGMKTLEAGENKVEVVVTAEDGTRKTYTINIIREVQQEEEEVVEEDEPINIEDGNGLLELKLGDLALTPEFKTDVYEYTVKYIGTDTKLNIETKATGENYIVEITGNEDLQEGENIITILVSDENGENVATYQITVNKSLEDYEAIAREEAMKKEKQQKIIIGSIGAVILVAIVIFIIVRIKRNRRFAEEYSGVDFYNRDDEYDDYEYDEFGINDMPSEELDYEDEYQEEIRNKHKGKRFK